jgi:hypothetical protein
MHSRSAVLAVALMTTILFGGQMLGADESRSSPVTNSKSNIKVLKAGSPDSPGPPESTFSLNLEDLYLRLTTGAVGSPSAFTEPTTAPETGTMYTIDEIMAVAPSPDNSTGAVRSQVVCNRAFWSLRTDGTWGLQVGTLDCGPMGSLCNRTPTSCSDMIDPHYGCCFGQRLYYCDSGRLHTINCALNPSCGYNASRDYMDCGQ